MKGILLARVLEQIRPSLAWQLLSPFTPRSTGGLSLRRKAPSCLHVRTMRKETWRIFNPSLKADTQVHEYEPKTWAPKQAVEEVFPVGGNSGHRETVRKTVKGLHERFNIEETHSDSRRRL
jgi:hypothetical protein